MKETIFLRDGRKISCRGVFWNIAAFFICLSIASFMFWSDPMGWINVFAILFATACLFYLAFKNTKDIIFIQK